MKKFLTIFFPLEKVHLYKDVGMIPYSLSKYRNMASDMLYISEQAIQDDDFAKHVTLHRVEKDRWTPFRVIAFLWHHRHDYDWVNVYHLTLKKSLPAILIKLFNPKCRVYLKLDLDEIMFTSFYGTSLKRKLLNRLKGLYVKHFIDLVTVESQEYYHELKLHHLFEGKLQYLPNGIEITGDQEQQQVADAAADKENIILFVGRVGEYQKNNELLVDAFSQLPLAVRADWKLVFAGSVKESFRSYVDAIEDESVKQNIVLLGNIEDKSKLYALYDKASIFAVTSRWESFCLVVLEAMYFANYVISTRFSAVLDILDNGNAGRIIPGEDVVALKEALVEALSNPAKRQEVAKLGQQRVQQLFMWRTIVGRLFDYMGAFK